MRFAVVQGPNINRLGMRRPERYGHESLSDLTAALDRFAGDVGVRLEHFQSNHEGELIDWVHSRGDVDGIIVNPAGLTPYGRSLQDAVFDVGCPVAVVHIAQLYRHYGVNTADLFKADADIYICGLGLFGYFAALFRLRQVVDGSPATLVDTEGLLTLSGRTDPSWTASGRDK